MEEMTSEKTSEAEKTEKSSMSKVFTENDKTADTLIKEKKRIFGYDKKNKRFFAGKFGIKRKSVIIILIIIIIIALFGSCSSCAKKKRLAAMAPKDVTVERHTVTKKVTGSSVIEPKDSYSIMTITTGEVTNDYINEGDTVKKGDKLYQFDAKTPQNGVSTAENALKKAQQGYADAVKTKSQTAKTNDKNVRSAQLGVEKARQNYNDALKTSSDLSVKSGLGGIVGEVFIKEGDIVGNSKIATVYNDKYLKIQVPFNENDADNISVGENAVLTIVSEGTEINGTVTAVNSESTAVGGHNVVKYVTIEAENPGALTSADKATAQVGDIVCNDAGQFEYANQYDICAETSGKIASVNISKNDTVYSGQVVVTLESNAANSNLKTAKLSLDDATLALEKAVLASDEYSQDSAIQSAKLQLDDARLALEKANTSLEDYTITAPISGTVVTKNSKAGDKIDSSNATTPMCIIYDMSSVQFDIDVDEIDIASIKVGQEVAVRADAVSGKTFKGIVEKVSVNGVAENGVTNYPVTVAITEYGELLPGMNVDAEIVVDEAEDVLAIPVSSLNRGDTVYIKSSGKDKAEDDKAPDGYRTVEVETGLSDDDYIEIKSGLSEGDLIRGQEVDNTGDLEKMMMQRMNGGNAGGEPPSGGGSGGRAAGGSADGR